MAGCERLVRVHTTWDGWQSAEVPIDALAEVHWRQPAGAPHPLIHAYLDCRSAVSAGLPHDCPDGTLHRLLVCIIKRHATASIFDALVDAAAHHPVRAGAIQSRIGVREPDAGESGTSCRSTPSWRDVSSSSPSPVRAM